MFGGYFNKPSSIRLRLLKLRFAVTGPINSMRRGPRLVCAMRGRFVVVVLQIMYPAPSFFFISVETSKEHNEQQNKAQPSHAPVMGTRGREGGQFGWDRRLAIHLSLSPFLYKRHIPLHRHCNTETQRDFLDMFLNFVSWP